MKRLLDNQARWSARFLTQLTHSLCRFLNIHQVGFRHFCGIKEVALHFREEAVLELHVYMTVFRIRASETCISSSLQVPKPWLLILLRYCWHKYPSVLSKRPSLSHLDCHIGNLHKAHTYITHCQKSSGVLHKITDSTRHCSFLATQSHCMI